MNMNSYSLSQPDTGVKAPGQSRSRRTVERLMAAVITLMSQGGLEACSASAVAAESGTAVGTLYRHFADKDALVAAALLDWVSLASAQSADAFSELVSGARDLDAFVLTLTRAAVAAATQGRRLILATRAFVGSYGDAQWRAAFQAAQGQGRMLVIEAAVARFADDIPGGETALRYMACALYGAVDAAFLTPQLGIFDTPPEPDAFVIHLSSLLQAGLRGRT